MGNIYNVVLSIFILMGVGYSSKKFNLISDSTVKELSKFIISVVVPSLIIMSFQREFSRKLALNSSTILIFATFYLIVLLGYYTVFYKFLKKDEKSVMVFMSIFSNTVYMGFPVIYEVFGEIGIFYAAVYNFVHTIFIWTLGVSLLSSDHGKRNAKQVLNPPMVAMLIGFFMFGFSIRLPVFIGSAFKILGGAATPLAMIVVGHTLASMEKGNIFQMKLLLLSASKLFLLPIILIFVLGYLPFDKEIVGVVLLQTAMPCPANAVLMAREYKSDYHLMSQGVFITTLLSIVSIPLIVYLFENFL